MLAPLSAILNPPEAYPSPPNTPSTPKKAHTHLSRDEQIWIRVLRDIGWKYTDIAAKYDCSIRAVQRACTQPQTPKKRSGRPPRLTKEEVECLIEFVSASKTNRRLAYWRLPAILGSNCGVRSVQHTLLQHEHKRHLARQKPPISAKNQQL